MDNKEALVLPTFEVQTTLPSVDANFEALEAQLRQGLEKYDLVIDEESVKTAKSMATEINGIAKQIDTLRKEKVKELKAPIDNFDKKCKILITLCQNSRRNLLQQVEAFDQKKKDECLFLAEEELAFQYKKFGIEDEFKTVHVADLAIVSNLNKNGIAKKAVDAIENRVLEVKELQDVVNKRLLELEGRCYKAGLKIPLMRTNINHFLKAGDEVYENELQSLIENELKRMRAIEQPKPEPIPQPKIEPTPTPSPTPINNKPAPSLSGKIRKYKIVFELEIEVDEALENRIEGSLRKKLERGGIQAEPKITIEKVVEAKKTEKVVEANNTAFDVPKKAAGSLF